MTSLFRGGYEGEGVNGRESGRWWGRDPPFLDLIWIYTMTTFKHSSDFYIEIKTDTRETFPGGGCEIKRSDRYRLRKTLWIRETRTISRYADPSSQGYLRAAPPSPSFWSAGLFRVPQRGPSLPMAETIMIPLEVISKIWGGLRHSSEDRQEEVKGRDQYELPTNAPCQQRADPGSLAPQWRG